jgi:uncharacterized protein
MEQARIIKETEQMIAREFGGEGSGHDWFHVARVRKLALRIGKQENCSLFIVEMAALLHDLDDWKLAESANQGKAKRWLDDTGIGTEISEKIQEVIADVSFKGAGVETPVRSVEAAVVQDADRLDAMGAIGIARTFAYGGHKNRLIYDPEIRPEMHVDFDAYQKSSAPTINHFYEKLLLLKNRMNTQAARLMAEERHQFMEVFLARFFAEWEA